MLKPDYVQQTFERFAKAVVKQARSNLTRGNHKATGELYKSLGDWKVKVGRGGSVSLVFNMEEYGEYQDRGVKGSNPQKSHKMREFTPFKYSDKMPPLKDLRKWVGIKRFQFRNKQGKFLSYDQTARMIQRSIYQKGIPQTLFFTKPFKRSFGKLPADVIEAFGNDVERFLTATFREKERFR